MTSSAVTEENWSGRRDSNSRPPAPKAGALTRLRYVPKPKKSQAIHKRSTGKQKAAGKEFSQVA